MSEDARSRSDRDAAARTIPRKPPDLAALVRVLAEHDVRYVVTGSVAALLHGVDLQPGDLDVTPALDTANLERFARALAAVGTGPAPDGPFGEWQTQPDGERRWVQRPPRPGEREARLEWRPDPADPSTFDELLESCHGALDIVPLVSGTYEDLAPRAATIEAFGVALLVESIADLLATLTIPRRPKDVERVATLRALQRRPPGGAATGGAGSEPVIASVGMEEEEGRRLRPEGA